MKLRISILAAAAALALAGCGDKKDGGDKGGGGEATGEPAGGETAGGGKAIDEAAAKAISETQIEGFEVQALPPKKDSAAVYYTTTEALESGQKIKVSAHLTKCMMCQKMDLAAWQANENLKGTLSKAAKEDPELVWEVEEVDLGGKTGIYTYKLAYSELEPEGGGKSRMASNSHMIWHNDGTNEIMMDISCVGSLPQTVTDEESLKASCPPEKQLEAAKTVFAAFATYF